MAAKRVAAKPTTRTRGVTFAEVTAMALTHAGVEEHVWFRTPALRVGKKSFARMKDAETLVLLVDGLDAKELLLAADPDVYFTTPHYDGYPYVLVRLPRARASALRPLIEAAWRLSAPRKLLAPR